MISVSMILVSPPLERLVKFSQLVESGPHAISLRIPMDFDVVYHPIYTEVVTNFPPYCLKGWVE